MSGRTPRYLIALLAVLAAALSLAGAAAGLALPGRGRAGRINAVAALETHA